MNTHQRSTDTHHIHTITKRNQEPGIYILVARLNNQLLYKSFLYHSVQVFGSVTLVTVHWQSNFVIKLYTLVGNYVEISIRS